jgi:hypothetical protein
MPKHAQRTVAHKHQPAHSKGGSRSIPLNRQPGPTPTARTDKEKQAFETWAKAEKEDALRVRLIEKSLTVEQQPKTKRRRATRTQRRARRLQRHLKRGITRSRPPATLASFLHMRDLRATVIDALEEAVRDRPDEDLRTATVINTQWSFPADKLDKVNAATLKRQFRTHLQRAGILEMPGFLVAFLHGEFEPTSGVYPLHFHLLTTAQKAAALKKRLKLKERWGYEKTATGGPPVVRSRVKDRPRQFSYLLKAYWPGRPVVMIEGKLKRVRKAQRIKGPYHTQVLLWLHRQSLSDLMLCNQCIYRNGRLFLK